MIDQNGNDSSNYQMIQSISVFKEMIDVRDCVNESAILNMDNVMHIINDMCLNKILYVTVRVSERGSDESVRVCEREGGERECAK